MSQKLYEEYDSFIKRGFIKKDIPVFVTNNLSQKMPIRPYQIDGLSRFFYYMNEDTEKKQPVQLLFNMATGSGKTYMMAGSILYLYQQGYRKFLFFVNSKNIIIKTRENFIDSASSKYLFADKILFGAKQANIREVENFSNGDGDDIEIKFTTIQQLHRDMNDVRENRVSYEEFIDKKIVMISDEAHHINATTKAKLSKEEAEEKESYEKTVLKILGMNTVNILLEYTATIDDKNAGVLEKYEDKLIYKYDLKAFRDGGWSKELDILRSDLSQDDRVLQALIVSQYRLKIAEKYHIRCKPVILFKAQKKIEESKEHERNFHSLIENLSLEKLATLRANTEVEIVQQAYTYFDQTIGMEGLIRELKTDFTKANCLNVNEDSLDKKLDKKSQNEVLSQATILNSLESKNNPIRAIFAVQKLNEWWDVLNLFDIVRMYGDADSAQRSNVVDKKTGKVIPWPQTVSEAQLIGRGARYYPFAYESYIGEDRYKRKFDKQDHELKILETFYYHAINSSEYISEIKQALRDIGMLDIETKPFVLSLKKEFMQTPLYREWVIYTNEKKEKPTIYNNTLAKIGITTKSIEYRIATGEWWDDIVFDEIEKMGPKDINTNLSRYKLNISSIDRRIVLKAIARNPFYTFESLKSHLGSLESMDEFVGEYIGSIEIVFASSEANIESLKSGKMNTNILVWVSKLLRILEWEISNREKEYEGTKIFTPRALSEVFIEKSIQVPLAEKGVTMSQNWFAFQQITSTSEEMGFIECMESMIDILKEKYDDIYLLRSERHFAIYNFEDGERFEPDFVLFLQAKNSDKRFTYQIFIEPKWSGFIATDQWKEDFLLEIEWQAEILDMNFWNYRLLGLPFYNQKQEQNFMSETKKKLL